MYSNMNLKDIIRLWEILKSENSNIQISEVVEMINKGEC